MLIIALREWKFHTKTDKCGRTILLYKYTGQEDIVIGSPVSGRSRAEFLNTIGVFINTIPIRSNVKGEKTFRQLALENKNSVIEGIKNQDYQFDMLEEKIGGVKDKSRNPLFDVMLTMWDMGLPDVQREDKEAKVDVAIIAKEIDGNLKLKFSYCIDLFTRDTAYLMRDHFLKLLEEIIQNREGKIDDLKIISEFEMTKLNNEKREQELNIEEDFDF